MKRALACLLCLMVLFSCALGQEKVWDEVLFIPDLGLYLLGENELWGVAQEDGTIVQQPQFDSQPRFENGYALVYKAESDEEVEKWYGSGHFYGILDSTGQKSVPCIYNQYMGMDGETVWVKYQDKWGCIDMQGNVLTDFQFDTVTEVRNGYAVVQERPEDGTSYDPNYSVNYGIAYAASGLILPMEYEYIGVIGEDLTVDVTMDGKTKRMRLTPEGAVEVQTVGSSLSLEDYMPFTGSKVAKLDGEPTLTKRADGSYPHPRLDGATALFPVYASVVEAVYPDETRYSDGDDALVTCTKTNRAYERLISGKTDLIFCAQPSQNQIEMAASQGVEFELTPFGKEAFVFIVNQENPLENISVEQIQQIYSGQITDWGVLGIPGLGEIMAYQRPENSGSQTALQDLMGDIPIMTPPQQRIFGLMDEIIENIEYNNLPNAIGYSFRFFCTEMMGSGVKLLSIDGIAPTLENIRNGSYPLTSTLYCVSRKGEQNPNVRALVDWVLSPQGQELVEKSGYVGVGA